MNSKFDHVKNNNNAYLYQKDTYHDLSPTAMLCNQDGNAAEEEATTMVLLEWKGKMPSL